MSFLKTQTLTTQAGAKPMVFFRVFGNRRDRKVMWGYIFGGTKKIPPHLPLTTVNPREPFFRDAKKA